MHVLVWPMGKLHFDGVADKVAYAQLLNDASEVKFSRSGGGAWMSEKGGEDAIVFDLPVLHPNVVVPVIELYLK